MAFCAVVLICSLMINQSFYGGSSNNTSKALKKSIHERSTADLPVWWFAPFFDKSSFGIEAATLVLGLIRSGCDSNHHDRPLHGRMSAQCMTNLSSFRSKAAREEDVWIGTSQGDCNYKYEWVEGMPMEDYDQLDAARKRANESLPAIVVCHSLPFFWARPFLGEWTCAPCPPLGYTAALAVGRAMAETDV